MPNFDKKTINTLIRNNIKRRTNDAVNNNVQPFLVLLNKNELFRDIYKERFDRDFVLSSREPLLYDCHVLFYDKLIKDLYEKRFGNNDEYRTRKVKIRKYTYGVFALKNKFLANSSYQRIDLLSSLQSCCKFFGTSKGDIASFYEKYTFFMNAVNNSRMCAWYARNLEEVVELYCIYNHLTSVDYEYILSDYEIDYKGIKVNGLSNFKEVCLKESKSTKKLTATKDLEISVLNGLYENDIDGFIEFMVGKIVSNPCNFSKIRYKSLILNAFKSIDESIKIEDERFFKQSCFSIFEWQSLIDKTGIIHFESNNDYYKFLYCCTKGMVESKGDTTPRQYELCKEKIPNFSYETELLILRSLIIIKHYNEDDKEHFVEKANKDLRELNMFQIQKNTDSNILIKGFGIDYVVTNNL